MFQWAVFYKILEIPDEVEAPTAYQLLALDPQRAYSSAQIQEALARTKKKLRQRLPGPQFIPILAAFEADLDRAGQRLASRSAGAAYDRKLKRRAARSSQERRSRARRRGIISAARKVVDSVLNEDGTLDAEKCRELREKLTGIGMREQEIKSLLNRIPVSEENHWEALAFPRTSVRDSDRDGEAPRIQEASRSKTDFFYQVGIPLLSLVVFSASIYYYVMKDREPSDADTIPLSEPEADPHGPLTKKVEAEATLPESVVVISPPKKQNLVWSQAYNERADLKKSRQILLQLDAPGRPGSYARILEIPPISDRKRPLVVDADQVIALKDDTVSEESVNGTQDHEEPGAISQKIIDQFHLPSSGNSDLLSDAVLVAVACAELTSEMAQSPTRMFFDLDTLLKVRDRATVLSEKTILMPMASSLPPDPLEAKELSEQEQQYYTEALSSESLAAKYHGLSSLGRRARAGSNGALEILFSVSNRQAALAVGMEDTRLLWRMILELQQIDDQRVAGHLVKLMNTSRQSAVAHRITYLLRDAINRDISWPNQALLSVEHKPIEHHEALKYWRELIRSEDFRWTPVPVESEQEPPPGWQPDWQAIRLLGNLEYHLHLIAVHVAVQKSDEDIETGEVLAQPQEGFNVTQYQKDLLSKLKTRARRERAQVELSVRRGVSHPDVPVVIPARVLPRLEESLAELLWELSRLVSIERGSPGISSDVGMILFQRRARKGAAMTALQRIAIDLDAASSMLELIAIAYGDESSVKLILKTIRRNHERDLYETPSVLVEIRNNLLRQFVLWELIMPSLEKQR